MANQNIDQLTTIAANAVDAANDKTLIWDDSAAGAARTKAMTVQQMAVLMQAVMNLDIADISGLAAALAGKQNVDPDLNAIAALTGTGLLRRNADNDWSLTSSGGGGASSFEIPFTDSSFTLAGLLIVPHNFSRVAASVRVLDASGVRIYPDEIDSGVNAVSLDFTLYRPFLGTGRVICI